MLLQFLGGPAAAAAAAASLGGAAASLMPNTAGMLNATLSSSHGVGGVSDHVGVGVGGGGVGSLFGANQAYVISVLLVVVGSMLTYFRQTVASLYSFVLNQFMVTVTIPRSELAYDWMTKFLHDYHQFASNDQNDHSNDVAASASSAYASAASPRSKQRKGKGKGKDQGVEFDEAASFRNLSSFLPSMSSYLTSQSYNLVVEQDDEDAAAEAASARYGYQSLSSSDTTTTASGKKIQPGHIVFKHGPGMHVLFYKRHVVWVQCSGPSFDDAGSSSGGGGGGRRGGNGGAAIFTSSLGSLTLTTYGRNKKVLHDLIVDAMQHSMNKDQSSTVIYTLDSYHGSGWMRAVSRAPRDMNSVILDGRLAETLVDDVKEFFNSREWYYNLGIPYRRAYLFYGPPGTGKTSFVTALAGQLNLSVCTLALTDRCLSDNYLNSMLRTAPANSLILLEDIDAAFGSREGDDDDDDDEERRFNHGRQRSNITFSGLINALDGVQASTGRIFVLTTNYKDRLDPALIRAGRVDVQVEFKLASYQQVVRIFNKFFPNAEQELDEERARRAAGGDPQVTFGSGSTQTWSVSDAVLNSTKSLAAQFADALVDVPVSMAELQRHFLFNKQNALRSMACVADLVSFSTQRAEEQVKRDARKASKLEEKRLQREVTKAEQAERRAKMKEKVEELRNSKTAAPAQAPAAESDGTSTAASTAAAADASASNAAQPSASSDANVAAANTQPSIALKLVEAEPDSIDSLPTQLTLNLERAASASA